MIGSLLLDRRLHEVPALRPEAVDVPRLGQLCPSAPGSRIPGQTINTIKFMILMVMSTTTIPVKPETLARLRAYKLGGSTYDDVLNDLMDDRPPAGFIREHLRRLKEEEFSDWKDVRKRLRL